MPNFPIASDTKVQEISDKIGTSADTANQSGTTGFSLWKWLVSQWTAARATKVDNLDATVSSRASAADMGTRADAAATVVNTTNTMAAYLKGIFNAVVGSSSVAGTSNRRVFWNIVSGTFTIPQGVTKILISACGGGGGGGVAITSSGNTLTAQATSGTATTLTGAVTLTLPGGGAAISNTSYNITPSMYAPGQPGGPGGGIGGNVDSLPGDGVAGYAGTKGAGGSGTAPGQPGGGSLGGGGGSSAGSGTSGSAMGLGGPSLVMAGQAGSDNTTGGKGGPGGGGGGILGAGPGGGGADAVWQKEYTVTPGAVLNFNLGKGGKGAIGASAKQTGGDGGNGMLIIEW